MKNEKPPSVSFLITGINQILSKNRESMTVDELKMLEDVKTKLESNNSPNQFIKSAAINFALRKFFDHFMGDEFDKWKLMLGEWIKEIDL